MKTLHTISRTDRRGVTLSEVLVSLLVMSIGVIAVATLFPLSVLRTVQATQLTNATQLRYNFEGMAAARPEVIDGAQVWQANRTYAVGDLVFGSDRGLFFYECTAISNPGNSGVIEPEWNATPGSTTTDNDVTWTTRGVRVYVVDPIGWQNRTEDLRDNSITPAVNSANLRNAFGRTSLAANGSTVVNTGPGAYDSIYRIVRFRGGIPGSPVNPSSSTFFPAIGSSLDTGAKFGAWQMAILPDSWVLQTDSPDVTVPAAPVTSLQLTNLPTSLIETLDRNNDSIVDLNVLGSGAERDISARVTLFDATGKFSYVRQLTGITSPSAGVEELAWTAALPAGFTPVRARVETFEARYSWMLVGRRSASAPPNLNLVVFFRRSTDPADELIHPAHFQSKAYPGLDGQPGVAGTDDDNNGRDDDRNELGWGGSDDVVEPYSVVVQYNAALGGQRPFLKRGGFICDSQNNRWYRIANFIEVDNADAALTQLDSSAAGVLAATAGAVIKLDQSAAEDSGIYSASSAAASASPGAILMPGIIDVYPLPSTVQ